MKRMCSSTFPGEADHPTAHFRRFTELPKVSFQVQGFYSPQTLSSTDAMDVMEAYMASAMVLQDCKNADEMEHQDEEIR